MVIEKDFLTEGLLSIILDDGITTKYNHFLISLIYCYVSENKMIKFLDDDLLSTSKILNNQLNNYTKQKVFEILKEYKLDDIRNSVYNILSMTKIDKQLIESSNYNISALVYKLLEINNDNHCVYDLGSGIGNFLASVYKYSKEDGYNIKELIGVEINKEESIISQMALDIICDSNIRPQITNDNGLGSIISVFDRGYVFPPFGSKVNDEQVSLLSKKIKFSSRNTNEWIYIDSLLSSVCNPDSRFVALVTGRALFNDADMEFRNFLINNGLLEGIIELPVGSLSYNGMKVFVLIFSRNNSEVKFVDASTIVSADNKRYVNLLLPIDDIYDLYCSKDVKTIKNEELLNKSNLSPSVNVLEVKEIKHGLVLGDIAEIITGSQYTLGVFENKSLITNVNTGYKILTSSDIDNGYIDFDSLKFVYLRDNKFDKFALHKGDLIITSKSSKVKTCVINIEPKEKVIVTGGMLIVRIKNLINPTYLKVFLDSQEGQNVLKSIQKGVTIVTINASSLSTITIPFIINDEQDKIAKKYNDLLNKYIMLKKELKSLEDEINNFNLVN